MIDADTDVDIRELLEKEPLCEYPALYKSEVPWCKTQGEWIVRITCRTCGATSPPLICCDSCKRALQAMLPIAKVIKPFVRGRKRCRHFLLVHKFVFIKL